MMTPDQREVWDLYKQGLSHRQIADKLGKAHSTVTELLKRARKHAYLEENPGIADALTRTGIDPGSARFGYRRVQNDDGSFDTVMWRMEEEEARDYAEALADAFSGIKPMKPVKAPLTTLRDFCTLYPYTDVHAGMHAWGRETGGQDYDLDHFRHDVAVSFAKLDAMTPNATQALLILNGDTFHSDDGHETPESGHKVDTDGRIAKVLDTGLEVFVDLVVRLLGKHESVRVRVMRGNHDKHSHLALSMGLRSYFRLEPRVIVEDVKLDLFQFQWGTSAIFAHHGDKGSNSPERLVMYISDVCKFWSETRHRYVFTGHVHHQRVKDFGAIQFESLRSFCPPDAYAAGMMFSQRRAVQALTFHRTDGLVMRAVDPLEHR